MNDNNRFPNFMAVLNRFPQAYANIQGNSNNPNLKGTLKFFQTTYGVVVLTQIMGLPANANECKQPIFGSPPIEK